MVEIAPSILSADFAHLARDVEAVERSGVSMIHVDVMDGHFVPNITIGPPVVCSLRKATGLLLDCHLMVENPDLHIPQFAVSGAQMISVHQEACPHLDRTIQLIKENGAAAGVVLNPATPVHTLSTILGAVDFVLVMSVNPGFGGQKFIDYALDKIRELDRLRRERRFSYRIEVDGGVSEDNVGEIVNAGCDIIVAGSSIFGRDDPAAAVAGLRRKIEEQALLRV